MSFQQGLSGLNGASKGLDVIGNDIANSNTVGFKSSQAHFSDVFANSLAGGSSNSIGIGTQVTSVAPQFTQGNISVTNNPLDMAINGKGFFRLSDNGAISYSRNGQFQVDKSGYITDDSGKRLTGYIADAGGNVMPSAPGDLQVISSDLAPIPTAKVTTLVNLDSRSTVPVTAAFNPTDPTSYTCSTSASIYDSLGNPHVLSFYFVKTATANTWDLRANVDGTAAANVDLGALPAGTKQPMPLVFTTGGALDKTKTTVPLNVSVDLAAIGVALGKTNGATTPLNFTLDFTGTTQFGSAFGVNSVTQDGYSSGRLSGMSVGADGVIQGRYTNGQSRNLGQVVLANFNNAQALQPLGSNQWSETPGSGPALVGAPNTSSLGVVQSGAVEDSNVDLTAELVNMITMQRAYQANAQTIKTQDAVMQTLVNLR